MSGLQVNAATPQRRNAATPQRRNAATPRRGVGASLHFSPS